MALLYIAGPVTGRPDGNRVAFEAAWAKLDGAGYHAYVPHDFVPPTSHEDAMLLCIGELTRSYWSGGWERAMHHYDGVALLEGWEQSEGARLEKAVAEACGIPCKTVDEWIEEAR